LKEGKLFGHLLPRLAIIAFAIFFYSLPAAAGERFTDNGDGTVSDHELGLMWSKTDNNGDINWIQAEGTKLFPRLRSYKVAPAGQPVRNKKILQTL